MNQMLRRRLPLALLAVGVAGAVALRTEADSQDPWAAFSENCAAFEGARVAIEYDDPRLDASRLFYVYALADGRIGIDELSGFQTRYAWSPGQPFSKHWRNQPSPRVVPGVARYLADVWEECRAGFSSSIWRHESPQADMYGYSKLWGWARLELPYDWATETPIWVAADKSGSIERIVLETAPEPLIVTVDEVNWDADVTPQQVSVLSQGERNLPPVSADPGIDIDELDEAGSAWRDTIGPSWGPTPVNPNCLSNPNGQLVRLDLGKQIKPNAWDQDGAYVRIVGVVSNEPDSGTRSGDLPHDIRFNGSAACVRAESSSPSAARVYSVTMEAKDASGNSSNSVVTVTVPGGQTTCAPTPYSTVSDSDPKCQF